MLVYADAQSLDISGPLEVFALASRQAQEDDPGCEPLYRLHVVAEQAGPIVLASGMQLLPDLAMLLHHANLIRRELPGRQAVQNNEKLRVSS